MLSHPSVATTNNMKKPKPDRVLPQTNANLKKQGLRGLQFDKSSAFRLPTEIGKWSLQEGQIHRNPAGQEKAKRVLTKPVLSLSQNCYNILTEPLNRYFLQLEEGLNHSTEIINLINESETAPSLSATYNVESPVKSPWGDFQRPASFMRIYLELAYDESF